VTAWLPALFCHPATAESKPLVATSACLLGEPVRYDGGHKYQECIERWLAPHLQLQAVCPEVGIGLGVPRPTLRVVGPPHAQSVVGEHDPALNVTSALEAYADHYVDRIGPFWPLCGWILKSRSPSCGAGSTPVNPAAAGEYLGYGRFAGRLATGIDWLSLCEESLLASEQGSRDFLLQVFLCRDILWEEARPQLPALAAHYEDLLGRELAADSAVALWRAVQSVLQAEPDRRAGLVSRFRAA
jgi:uncharacterized protein YbbK (DUF523 family)